MRKITPTTDFIGTRNESTDVIETRINLLTSPVASIGVDRATHINLYIDHVGNIADDIDMLIETSPDNVNFYPLVTVEDSATLATVRNRPFRYTTTTASDVLSLPINVQDSFFRVSFSGTGSIYASLKLIY